MELVSRIATNLLEKEVTLSTAESCTGGLAGHLLTNVAGSSRWYAGGVVAYSNTLKHKILGVHHETLNQVGAVSPEVARQMALGARQVFDSDYALSVTGIAGPGGGSPEKPTGLVYVAVAGPEMQPVRRYLFNGSREANKQSSVDAVFALLLEVLEGKVPEETPVDGAAVDAAFSPDGTIRPVTFTWNGQPVRIAGYGRQWEQEGKRHFLVMTAGDRLWELVFDPASVRWSVTPKSEARWAV